MIQIDISTLPRLRQSADIIEEASALITYIGIIEPGTPAGTDETKLDADVWMIIKVEQSAAEGIYPNVTTIKFAEAATSFSKVWNNRATYDYKFRLV